MPTSFESRVYSLAKRIPKGMVSTYGEIARKMRTGAYQAVGNALHNNPTPIIVPCHRVVKSDGSLGGFAGGKKRKILLLKKEGVKVRKGMIADFERILFRF
ncbi:MAG: MGMT family protein [Candidatus Woesearchaeota archaeon]|nr:MGMT family protein [Candidatus Woesearchaeota archaeon]